MTVLDDPHFSKAHADFSRVLGTPYRFELRRTFVDRSEPKDQTGEALRQRRQYEKGRPLHDKPQSSPMPRSIEDPGHKTGDRFLAYGRWIGRVVSIGDESLLAHVQDLLHPDFPVEEVEFEWEDVSAPDRDLVMEGAEFSWVVGYRVTSFGQRYKSSFLRFQRRPRMTESDFTHADAWADDISNTLTGPG